MRREGGGEEGGKTDREKERKGRKGGRRGRREESWIGGKEGETEGGLFAGSVVHT